MTAWIVMALFVGSVLQSMEAVLNQIQAEQTKSERSRKYRKKQRLFKTPPATMVHHYHRQVGHVVGHVVVDLVGHIERSPTGSFISIYLFHSIAHCPRSSGIVCAAGIIWVWQGVPRGSARGAYIHNTGKHESPRIH